MPGMSTPRFTSIVHDLPSIVPFVGPEAIERQNGQPFKARLGANESVFGPSPKVAAAIAEAAASVWKYGDPENHDLKAAIARFHGVAPANIAVGEGIDGLMGLTVRMFVEPGAPVVTSLGAYPTLIYHVNGHGGRLVTVPYHDDNEDPVALIEAARRESARIVYLANPDNPMGTWLPADRITEMISNLPDGTLMFLDEAYADTAPPGAIPRIDVSNPAVIRFRTFSKAYGMAGMRVGYAIGEATIIAAFDKVRNHFGVTRLSQVAALAALADQSYLNDVVSKIANARQRIAGIAIDNGLSALPSATNFVTIDCGRDGAFARAVLAGLIEGGIFVRMPAVPPLDRCIRISAGAPNDLDVLSAVLPGALTRARSIS